MVLGFHPVAAARLPETAMGKGGGERKATRRFKAGATSEGGKSCDGYGEWVEPCCHCQR